jgi:DNA-directed RNA polymerase I, II, and III subunit RPABC1
MEKKDDLNVDNMSKEDLSRLFKVWKTLRQMMEVRGYEKDTEIYDYPKWISKIKEKKAIDGTYIKIDKKDPNKKIKLYYRYFPEQKINSDSIKQYLTIMRDTNINSGIIIVSGKLSQQAKQKIQDINKELQVEIFTVNELVVNITEHELVPEHILLPKEEKDLLLKRYKIKENQLPKILVTDPVARFLGLKRGDVVKITRVSETAGKYITYRIAC